MFCNETETHFYLLRKGLLLSVSVLTFAEVLLFPGGSHAVPLAGNLMANPVSPLDAQCVTSVYRSCHFNPAAIEEGCLLLALPVGQPTMKLKVLEDEKTALFLCFCRMTQRGR